MGKLLNLAAALVLILGTLCFLVSVVLAPSPDLSRARWVQKDPSLYDGAGTYMVRIRVASTSFHPLMLGYVVRYEALVTHEKNPDYGHVAAIDFDDAGIDGVKGILRTKVNFGPGGVTLTQPRGKKLFIPKGYFLGGR